MEIFAHTLGCILILGTLLWIDDRNRKKLWNASVFILFSGLLANLAKYVIPRNRPSTFDTEPWNLLNPDRDPEAKALSSWDVWGRPFTESWFDESIRSFPSGHYFGQFCSDNPRRFRLGNLARYGSERRTRETRNQSRRIELLKSGLILLVKKTKRLSTRIRATDRWQK